MSSGMSPDMSPGTSSGSSEPAETPRRLKVVVADDQAAVREPLAAVLGLSGDIDVVAAAADGNEVLAAVAAGPVDVVLMDLRMPVMDGIEATRRLAEEHPEVAVVVLTTFADDDSILSALGAGARGYLTKNAGRRRTVRTRPGRPGPAARRRQKQDACGGG
jgi:DNA-binding NarL/FixJ family response regulator